MSLCRLAGVSMAIYMCIPQGVCFDESPQPPLVAVGGRGSYLLYYDNQIALAVLSHERGKFIHEPFNELVESVLIHVATYICLCSIADVLDPIRVPQCEDQVGELAPLEFGDELFVLLPWLFCWRVCKRARSLRYCPGTAWQCW